MVTEIYISHIVGWCPVCGFRILDTGYSDDMEHEFLYDNLTEAASWQSR